MERRGDGARSLAAAEGDALAASEAAGEGLEAGVAASRGLLQRGLVEGKKSLPTSPVTLVSSGTECATWHSHTEVPNLQVPKPQKVLTIIH